MGDCYSYLFATYLRYLYSIPLHFAVVLIFFSLLYCCVVICCPSWHQQKQRSKLRCMQIQYKRFSHSWPCWLRALRLRLCVASGWFSGSVCFIRLLRRYLSYGSGPKRFPLADVLQYALEFASSKPVCTSPVEDIDSATPPSGATAKQPPPHTRYSLTSLTHCTSAHITVTADLKMFVRMLHNFGDFKLNMKVEACFSFMTLITEIIVLFNVTRRQFYL